MKIALLCMFALLAIGGANAQENIIDVGIRRFMEQFRLNMECGFPQANIPVLAPMRIPQMAADINLNTVAYNGLLGNVYIPDLNTFQIRGIQFSMVTMRMEFDMFYPFINVNGQFANGVGRSPGNCAISGSGQFQIRFNGLNMHMVTRIGVAGGLLVIAEMTTRTAIQSFNSNINQFVGTAAQSQQCNRVLESEMPSVIAANQARLSAFFERLFRPIATDFIQGMTLQDLLDVITLPATPVPCRRSLENAMLRQEFEEEDMNVVV